MPAALGGNKGCDEREPRSQMCVGVGGEERGSKGKQGFICGEGRGGPGGSGYVGGKVFKGTWVSCFGRGCQVGPGGLPGVYDIVVTALLSA